MKYGLALGALTLSLLLPVLGGCGGSSTAGGTPGTGDGGATADGGPDAGSLPSLSNLPADTWTWVDFPDSRCGNGTPTGIGVNPHAGATHLVIFLMGGGACVDANTCWINPTASNIASGYNGASFKGELVIHLPILERSTTASPFHDANLVFVPYCTGDIHIGTGIAMYTVNGTPTPTYHYGGHNLDLFLASLAATYKGLDRVWLSGVSAGGFGSFMNQDFVVRAVPGARVDVVDDSGPAIDDPFLGFPMQWAPRVPPGCSDCATIMGLSKTFAYDRATYPTTRYALLTYQTDSVLPMFYGQTPAQMSMQIQQFVSSLTSDPNAKSFVELATGHVVMLPTSDTAANNALLPWLTQMLTDDPSWASAQY